MLGWKLVLMLPGMLLHRCQGGGIIAKSSLVARFELFTFFLEARRKEVSHSARNARHAPQKSQGVTPSRARQAVQIAHVHRQPVHTSGRTQRPPQQAGSARSLDGASQQSGPSLEEQELGRTAKDPGHRKRLVPSQIPQERDGAGAPPSCHLKCHHKEMAPGPSEQLGIPPTLVLFRFVDGLPLPATPRRSPTCQRGDNRGVNDDLLASPE